MAINWDMERSDSAFRNEVATTVVCWLLFCVSDLNDKYISLSQELKNENSEIHRLRRNWPPFQSHVRHSDKATIDGLRGPIKLQTNALRRSKDPSKGVEQNQDGSEQLFHKIKVGSNLDRSAEARVLLNRAEN
jgi:hypothetical protein